MKSAQTNGARSRYRLFFGRRLDMRNHQRASVLVLVGLFLALGLAWASITGSISGMVTDPTGAVISGASVVATNTQTGVKTAVTTDTKGFYSLPTLAIGAYELLVTQAGFKSYTRTGLVIDANSALRVDAALQVGAISEKMEVRTDSVHVETESSQMGEVIAGKTITAVPLNGRAFTDLLALQTGVSPYNAVDTGMTGVNDRSVDGGLNSGNQSVNGQREASNGFMVNGSNVEEGKTNGAAIIPNLDSIAEFRIITNNFDAEYGNYSGGQINVITKSGTNGYHGDLFEFLRNTNLDAANYFTGRGDFKQNQFGGIFGGPIKKNKLFFFADYQGTRQIIGAPQHYPVPSTADRSGNLSDLASSFSSGLDAANNPIATTITAAPWATVLGSASRLNYPVSNGEPYYYAAGMVNPATIGSNGIGIPYTNNCTSNDPVTGCVFPNAVIPQNAWDPVAVNMLKYIPSPNGNGAPTYSTSAFNETLTDNKGGIRIDANFGKNMLFGYYFADKYNVANPYASVNVPGFTAVTHGTAQMINLGLTTTVSNSTVNEARPSGRCR